MSENTEIQIIDTTKLDEALQVVKESLNYASKDYKELYQLVMAVNALEVCIKQVTKLQDIIIEIDKNNKKLKEE